MQSVEITAKSVDEAKRLAAEKLGVAPETITTTVLEETKGLFGKTTVRVRAEVAESASESAPASAPAPEPAPAAPAAKGRSRRGGKAGASEPIEEIEESFEEPAPVAEAPAPVAPEPAREGGRSRGRRGGRRGEESASETAPATEGAEESEAAEIVATDEDAENLANILRELLVSADISATVAPAGLNGRYVNLRIDGKDAAHLVGKHGEVLNALQYLVNIIAGRRLNNGVRATLDGNDYRKRREETLTQLATNIAEQVLDRGEEAVLDALPAFERRIVHKALSTIDGISTYSEGEEPNRRVVIAPAE